MAPIDAKSLDPQQGLVRSLRIENRSLRRELHWNADEVRRLKEKAAQLEAQLATATQHHKRFTAKQAQPARVRAPQVLGTIDWGVLYLLGSGARELEDPSETALFWDNIVVDWSGRELPKGIVPKTKYWDRGLPLDWNADGLPTLGFKLKAQRAKANTPRSNFTPAWGVQHAPRDGSTRTSPPKQVVELIREQRAARAQVADEDTLAVDWSGRMPPLHRPARCNAVAGVRRSRPGRVLPAKSLPSATTACDVEANPGAKAHAKARVLAALVPKLRKPVMRRPVSNFVRQPCARH